MEIYGKNVFNKDAGFIANAFGVVAVIWLMPIILIFVGLDIIFSSITKAVKKIKSWI